MSHHSHIKDFMVIFREASMDWMLSLRREWEWLGWDRLTGTWNWWCCHFRLKVSDWSIGCCFDWLFDWSFGGNGSLYGSLCCSALLCWIGILAVEMSTNWYIDWYTLSVRRRSDRLLSRHGGRGRGRVYYSEWAVWNLTKEQLDL